MRIALSFLFFCLPFGLIAQLSGQYSTSPDFVVETLDFCPNNEFIYHQSSCTGGSLGRGHYILKGNVLKLVFDIENLPDTTIKVRATDPHNDSVINISLSFYEYSNAPLPGAVAVFDKTQTGCESKENGNCAFNISRSDTNRLLEFSAVGYDQKDYTLALNKDYEIRVFFRHGQLRKAAKIGEIWTYDIRFHKSSNVIDMRRRGAQRGFGSWVRDK